jgi:hypothetical protein
MLKFLWPVDPDGKKTFLASNDLKPSSKANDRNVWNAF